MTLPWRIAAASVALAAAALLLAGRDGAGRVMLAAGLSGPAAALAADPAWRGAALFRDGQHEAAADAFARAGDRYSEGVAAAHAGDPARALAAWDAALLADPDDREAAENAALIRSVFAGTGFDEMLDLPDRDRDGPTLAAETGEGGARAASTGSEAQNTGPGFEMPEIVGEGLRRVPRIFDAQYLEATARWLDTLSDEPGLYLRARLKIEQDRREDAGIALPQAEDPR